MQKLSSILLILAVAFIIQSCNIINPKEEIPTYIFIDSIALRNVAPGVHGSPSERITDAWVYLDNNLIGAFELPAKIPIILLNASNEVSVRAGIWDNGISGTRVQYPYYIISNHVVPASPGNTIPIEVGTEYNANVKFHLIEDFEQGNSFVRFLNADTMLVRTSTVPSDLRGSNIGKMEFNRTNGAMGGQAITSQAISIPGTLQSYIEMDYRCDVPITIASQVTGGGAAVITGDIISLKERTGWNKVYINLTEYGVNYSGRDFNFMIKAALPDGQNEGFVEIDNFKVLSF
jgi:hypothetical protein